MYNKVVEDVFNVEFRHVSRDRTDVIDKNLVKESVITDFTTFRYRN